MTNNLTPSGEVVLGQLGINPHNLRADFPTREQRLQYRAVVQWLTDYKPKSDATNLEKVKGYLEAFYHLCKVEAWEAAIQIILNRLNTPTKEQLHNHLNTWGYYREQCDIYDRLLEKIYDKFNNFNLMSDANWHELGRSINIILAGLGNCYLGLSEYEKAIEYYQQRLTIAQNTGDSKGEGWILANISRPKSSAIAKK